MMFFEILSLLRYSLVLLFGDSLRKKELRDIRAVFYGGRVFTAGFGPCLRLRDSFCALSFINAYSARANLSADIF